MAITRATVITRLKSGETIYHTLPKGDCDADRPVQYLSGGGRVTTAIYEHIKPSLTPVSVGLFADAEPQEWRWQHEH